MVNRLGITKLAGAGICCLALISFLFIMMMPQVSALPVTDDFEVSISPTRVEGIIGGSSGQFAVMIGFDGDFLDENGDFAVDIVVAEYIYAAPAGVTIGGGWNPVVNGIGRDLLTASIGDGSVTVAYFYTIDVAPSFTFTEEFRVDLTFICYWDTDSTSGTLYQTVSIYVIPVEDERWTVDDYHPDSVTMTDNENETLYLTITNSYDYTLDFSIYPSLLNSGFSVSPASTLISIDPGDSYQWTTTLTCTGYGLKRDNQYVAVSWTILETGTEISKQGGYTRVTYVGIEPENVANLDLRWYPDSLVVPFGEWDNSDLVITNLGPGTSSIDLINIRGFADSPLWIYSYDDPGLPQTLGEDENLTIRFSFWSHGDVEDMQRQSGVVARVSDNAGNVREAEVRLRATVGTFDVDLSPRTISLEWGQVGRVHIIVTNNENFNRSYIIYAEEETRNNVTWASSDPSIENVVLTPFASRRVEIEVKALGSVGTYPYIYYVHCEQTGYMVHAELSVDIIDLPTGVYPQAFPEFLLLLAPLTGGSVEAAAGILSVVALVIFGMIGLAIGGHEHGGLGAIMMTLFGVTLVTVLGWFPSWILGLSIILLALGLAGRFRDVF